MAKQGFLQFLASLPELSRPGITEDHVYTFLKNYSNKTPPAGLKVVAAHFIKHLPDSNEFSQLDLMVLVNTLRNNFVVVNDYNLGYGLFDIVREYDRSVINFEDLISTIRIVSNKFKKLADGSKEVRDLLFNANEMDKRKNLCVFKNTYSILLNEAKKAIKSDNIQKTILCLEEAIKTNPRRSEAYFALANVYNSNGSFDESLCSLSKLLDSEPCDLVVSKSYITRADFRFVKGDYSGALEDLKLVNDNDYLKYRLKELCTRAGRSYGSAINSCFRELYFCTIRSFFDVWKSKKKKWFFPSNPKASNKPRVANINSKKHLNT